MAVITKKDEKIALVVASFDKEFSFDEFLKKFQEMYPKDWEKTVRNYIQHERKTKEGKTHPMPDPKQYLQNSLNVWQKKNK